MSDGSPLPVQQPVRPLRADERELVQALLSGVFSESEIEHRLPHPMVQDLSDDGMGSIRFANPMSANRRFGREADTADYVDHDGVLVSITLNLDQEDDLFEVDFWKVNFSPLVRYPTPQDLRVFAAQRAAPKAAMVSQT